MHVLAVGAEQGRREGWQGRQLLRGAVSNPDRHKGRLRVWQRPEAAPKIATIRWIGGANQGEWA